MQELIKVYAQTPEKAARFRGKYLINAEHYFPLLDQWCPPIYIGVKPPGNPVETYHHIPFDATYIFIQDVDVIPGDNDTDAQAEYIYHELAHVVEHKIGKPYDERFAQAIHAAVAAGNTLVYVMLSHMMGI